MFSTVFRPIVQSPLVPVQPAPAPQPPSLQPPAPQPPAPQPPAPLPLVQQQPVQDAPVQQAPVQEDPPIQPEPQPAADQTGSAPATWGPAASSSPAARTQNQTLAAVVIASARLEVSLDDTVGRIDEEQRARQLALNAQDQYRRMALIEALSAPPQHVALQILAGPTRRDDGAAAVVVAASAPATNPRNESGREAATPLAERSRWQQRR